MPVQVFNDFSGGWLGVLDPSKVTPTMFDARNMIVYRDGSLGPRPGIKQYSLTSYPTDRFQGRVRGLAYTGHPSKLLLALDTNNVVEIWNDHSVNELGSIVQGVGETSYTTHFILPITSDLAMIFAMTDDDKLYKVNHAAPVQTSTLAINVGTVYGARVVGGGQFNASTPTVDGNLLYYTAQGDLASWPLANNISIGFAFAEKSIVYLSSQRDHLAIATQDGEWWVLTGVPGLGNTNLRRVKATLMQPAGLNWRVFTTTGDDIIHYLAPDGNYPSSFDGASVTDLRYLQMAADSLNPGYTYAIASDVLATTNAAAFRGTSIESPAFTLGLPSGGPTRLLLRHNGSWVVQDFTQSIVSPTDWTSNGRGLLWTVENTTVTPRLFVSDWQLNRPPFVADENANPGDLSTTTYVDAWVQFPEVWTPNSDMVTVSEVVLDIYRWNVGVANAVNAFDVKVESLGRGSEVALGSTTVSWSRSATGMSVSVIGTPDRVRIPFGNQGAGAGYRVKVSGIKGVALRSVVVTTASNENQGRPYGG